MNEPSEPFASSSAKWKHLPHLFLRIVFKLDNVRESASQTVEHRTMSSIETLSAASSLRSWVIWQMCILGQVSRLKAHMLLQKKGVGAHCPSQPQWDLGSGKCIISLRVSLLPSEYMKLVWVHFSTPSSQLCLHHQGLTLFTQHKFRKHFSVTPYTTLNYMDLGVGYDRMLIFNYMQRNYSNITPIELSFCRDDSLIKEESSLKSIKSIL